MSNRTLIEINHDRLPEMGDDFLQALQRYVRSANWETAADLDRYGVHVIGMRHHSGNFIIDGTPDGFPVQHLERQKP